MSSIQARNTIILSDIHLADAEPPHPHNPLWKRFKRPRYFVDRSFQGLLQSLQSEIPDQIELVLNGDIFDFDSITALPEDRRFKINWLERLRGLKPEERKSAYKMDVILRDHPVWFDALRDFLDRGNRLVFVIGNHDVELHWPSVQERILSRICSLESARDRVRFCEWFYVSNRDTLIEHGNQYDDMCICADPIHPLIRRRGKVLVRSPFGNLAGKLMTNGMGLMNPHVESSYIKETFREYLVFFYRYMVRVQPLILWTWFWGAMCTLYLAVADGLKPPLKDPLMVETRIHEIAVRSNSVPRVVRGLREIQVHPAVLNPIKILRELWLDRALVLLGMAFLLFQFFALLNVIFGVSFFWWYVIPLFGVFPVFIFYARGVKTELAKADQVMRAMAPLAARIAKVQRVVHGHSHHEKHSTFQGIEILNPGTWSPAFRDPECTMPYGRKCYVRIRPEDGRSRVAELFEWDGKASIRIEREEG